MKLLTKLSILTVTVATFAGSTAFADNSTLRTLIDLDRQKAERNKTTTVAVYSDRHGVGQRSAVRAELSKTYYELRWNTNGQRFGLFVRDSK